MEEGATIFYSKLQLINVGGIMEIGNHHLANTTAIIVAGKKHWCVLKLMGESMMRNGVFVVPKYLTLRNLSF